MTLDVVAMPSPNFNDRNAAISLILLHYTGMQSGEAALERLRDREAQVSAHYVVEEEGRIFQLVGEDKRAWHAGLAKWQGESDVNSASIGIEIVNGGHDFGLPAYPSAQIESVIALVRDLLDRHGLAVHQVIGHSDVAPGRKQDPGEHFPWDQLAAAGCALTRPDLPGPGGDVGEYLSRIGYSLEAGLEVVITAFQRRWRPERVDGVLDDETRALIAAVATHERE